MRSGYLPIGHNSYGHHHAAGVSSLAGALGMVSIFMSEKSFKNCVHGIGVQPVTVPCAIGINSPVIVQEVKGCLNPRGGFSLSP